jgi:N-methylhydantoinase A
VAVIGALPSPPQEPRLADRPPGAPRARRRIYLGAWQEVPLFDFAALAPGQEVTGPALIESATTTVLLRPGDDARATAIGWLEVSVADG